MLFEIEIEGDSHNTLISEDELWLQIQIKHIFDEININVNPNPIITLSPSSYKKSNLNLMDLDKFITEDGDSLIYENSNKILTESSISSPLSVNSIGGYKLEGQAEVSNRTHFQLEDNSSILTENNKELINDSLNISGVSFRKVFSSFEIETSLSINNDSYTSHHATSVIEGNSELLSDSNIIHSAEQNINLISNFHTEDGLSLHTEEDQEIEPEDYVYKIISEPHAVHKDVFEISNTEFGVDLNDTDKLSIKNIYKIPPQLILEDAVTDRPYNKYRPEKNKYQRLISGFQIALEDGDLLVLDYPEVVINNLGTSQEGFKSKVDMSIDGTRISFRDGDSNCLANIKCIANSELSFFIEKKPELYKGYYATHDNKIANSKLSDNHYYNEYSYEIKSQVSQKDYNELLKETVHPAGFAVFGLYDAFNDSDNEHNYEITEFSEQYNIYECQGTDDIPQYFINIVSPYDSFIMSKKQVDDILEYLVIRESADADYSFFVEEDYIDTPPQLSKYEGKTNLLKGQVFINFDDALIDINK
jgi:hypothetical protein